MAGVRIITATLWPSIRSPSGSSAANCLIALWKPPLPCNEAPTPFGSSRYSSRDPFQSAGVFMFRKNPASRD